MSEGCGNHIGPYSCCSIITGDAKELAKAIPDESVDLIFTDPVYDRIEDYRWLAEAAARVLRKGGNCIAQHAHHYAPQVYRAMNGPLEFVWPLVERLGTANARMWDKRIFVHYKPWVWYAKGKRNGAWVRDLIQSEQSKAFHAWGDGLGFIRPYIAHLMDENDTLIDFFCGGGTMPVATVELGRHYLAFEIDPEVAERARERVRNTQPPLFVMQPEQVEMAI